MNHHRFRAGLRRKVALVADAHNLAVEPERKQNLCGRWKQRNDAHSRGMYHICKTDEERELGRGRPIPILTSDRFFRYLALDRSGSPILPTTRVPDPRFSHAELTLSKFLSLRLPWHSCFFEQIFQPARDAVAENAGARPGVPP